MSPDEITVILDQVLEMTERMLTFAQDENWVELAKLEGVRQQALLDSLSGADIHNSEVLSAKIQQILELDSKMQAIVVQARDSLRDEIIELNKSKAAVKAYHSE